MSITPYVVGQWVRGEKFYGRSDLIEEILHGNRNWLWLLGTRRIGKTSLLKQVEHLTTSSPDLGYFPMFWDFQGADDPQELHLGFGDSLLDAEDRLALLGIRLSDVEADDLFSSLSRLRRKLRKKNTRLLLLCDEVEELIKLNKKDPSLLRKLRRALQSQEDVRSVLASTIRLWALSDERGDTSPFLHGFTPPLYIHNLDAGEARSLILQSNLPSQSRPRFDDRSVELIRSHCDNHPYLIQLLCKRFVELEDFEEALDQISTDPMVSFFFSVDFEMLSDVERRIIRIIAEHDSSTSKSIQEGLPTDSEPLAGNLHRLQHLGYIRRNKDQRFVLVNYFFRRWFRDLPKESGAPPVASDESPTAALTDRGSLYGRIAKLIWSSSSAPAGSHTTASYDVELGPFDGRYKLVKRIGKGATGMVYKAHDTLLRVDIAIKLLKNEYAIHEDAIERLRREIILSRDIAHPNVVRVYHLGEVDGKKYITMQWIDGSTLGETISQEGPIPPERAVGIAIKLAGALEAAHDCGVLHRDIKPQNILMREGVEPFVTDFGLARLAKGPGVTRDGLFVGTPNYASPEQADMTHVDGRSDLYSLGVVLFEMVTGRRPFEADTTLKILTLHREAAPPAPEDIRPGISSDLSSLILRCLEKDPGQRYQSAGELRTALEQLHG